MRDEAEGTDPALALSIANPYEDLAANTAPSPGVVSLEVFDEVGLLVRGCRSSFVLGPSSFVGIAAARVSFVVRPWPMLGMGFALGKRSDWSVTTNDGPRTTNE